MTTRIPLPPEGASAAELWQWIEKYTPLIEALNQEADEVLQLAYELGLTKSETELFRILYNRRDTIVSQSAIADYLYALRPDDPPQVKIIDVYVCKMRKKLQDTGFEIETVWGLGYILRVPNSLEELEDEDEEMETV